MEKDTLIKDITVEWGNGIARGFKSKEDAERFIKRISKKTGPNLKYSVFKLFGAFNLNKGSQVEKESITSISMQLKVIFKTAQDSNSLHSR